MSWSKLLDALCHDLIHFSDLLPGACHDTMRYIMIVHLKWVSRPCCECVCVEGRYILGVHLEILKCQIPPPHPVFHNVKPPQLHPVVHHCWRSSQFQAVFSFFHSDSWAFLQVNIRHGEARDIFPSQFLSTNVSTHASFIYRIFSVYLGILCICWFYWNWPKISFCKKKKKKRWKEYVHHYQ